MPRKFYLSIPSISGGITPTSAKKIANALGVAVDDLLPNASELRTIWWVSGTVEDAETEAKSEDALIFGSIFREAFDLPQAIQHIWSDFAKQLDRPEYYVQAKASLKNRKLSIELTQYVGANKLRLKYLVKARPVTFILEKGITWREVGEIEEQIVRSDMLDFLFRLADAVVFDGQPFPPEQVQQCYQVSARARLKHSFPILECVYGANYFYNQVEFYISLGAWMHSNGYDSSLFCETEEGIGIKSSHLRTKRTDLENFEISIECGWLDSDRKFHVGPWPMAKRKILTEGKINLISYFQHFSDAESSPLPFEPELHPSRLKEGE